jgi:zona occludens toxin (predicted ATPase)
VPVDQGEDHTKMNDTRKNAMKKLPAVAAAGIVATAGLSLAPSADAATVKEMNGVAPVVKTAAKKLRPVPTSWRKTGDDGFDSTKGQVVTVRVQGKGKYDVARVPNLNKYMSETRFWVWILAPKKSGKITLHVAYNPRTDVLVTPYRDGAGVAKYAAKQIGGKVVTFRV